MNPQKINEAVAKKLGWKPKKYSKLMGQFDELVTRKTKRPDYCGDIRAAWDIVEHLNSAKWMIFNPGNTNTWVASITDLPDGSKSNAEADTAPIAICLAFLKLEEIKLDRKG